MVKRRHFISKGLPGITGAMALSHLGCESTASRSLNDNKKHKLVYRTLGKTGIKVPVVGMGSMNVTSESLVRNALGAGISYIATAREYARGRVEEFIGKVIKNYKREDIILAASVTPGPRYKETGGSFKDVDTAKFERDFEGSLKRMDVDYVDIFFLPYVQNKETAVFEPLMNAMEKMKKAGKARFLGAASHRNVPGAVRAIADSDFFDVVMLSYNFRIKDIEERKEAVAYAAGKGMGIVAMKTITGESWVDTDKQIPDSNPGAALKWVLQNENIHTTVPGFTNFDQLETDLSVMADLTLTPEEKKYLELVRLNDKDSLFCQGCGNCLKQCDSAPDIPTLMRCYMYVYGYRDLAAAVRNLESVRDKPIACSGCSSCKVKCPSGFNIKERVLDIIRLRDFPPEFLA